MPDSFIKVADITRTSLHMIDGLATVQEAIATMRKHSVSSLVIDRRNAADEYGMLTVQDIAAKVVSENRSTERTSVYEVMAKPTVTLNATMNIKYGIRLLATLGYTRALVMDGNGLMGLVTLRDMVLAYTGEQEDKT